VKSVARKLVASAIILLASMGVGAILVEAYFIDTYSAIIAGWIVAILFTCWASVLLYETVNMEAVDTSDSEEDGLE